MTVTKPRTPGLTVAARTSAAVGSLARGERRRGTDRRRNSSVNSAAGSRTGSLDDSDRLAPFGPAILAVRWSTTVASIVLAAPAFFDADFVVIPWVAAVVCNTAIRTVSPLRYTPGSNRALLNLIIEVGFNLLAVTATGFWHSPLVLSLVNAVIIAAFARGFGFGLRIGAASAIAVSLPGLERAGWTTSELALAAQWTTVLLLVGIVAGYGRRISWEASQQHVQALDRLSRLADANSLLFNLHRVAQTLPASLDYEEVLDSTVARMRGLIEFDSTVILTLDDADGSWSVAKRHGVKLPATVGFEELPPGAQRAIGSRRLQLVGELNVDGGGFSSDAMSGIYVPLTARGALIGLLAIESRDREAYRQRDREVLNAFVEPAALAIDNAQWFGRLRTVGADEERTRIARDLHDRIGQSLAYLAFELDRIVRRDATGDPVTENLAELRADLRGVIGEVRDTLYDLRTDVGNERDFSSTIREFTGRVAERSDLQVALDCDSGARLPILQEREMWRIAQEALINVERHADASRVSVIWRCDGTNAELVINDDGRGFPDGKAGRLDSYGILGMKERAASIGAALELISHPGEGTTVRCSLAQR